jgi:hypothetical protein
VLRAIRQTGSSLRFEQLLGGCAAFLIASALPAGFISIALLRLHLDLLLALYMGAARSLHSRLTAAIAPINAPTSPSSILRKGKT